MNTPKPQIIDESGDKYKYGFVTDIEAETVPKGLNAEIIRLISQKKGEPGWLLEWRLKAFEFWQTMSEPTWAKLAYDKIDYQDLFYYAAPKQKADAPQSLDEVDPVLWIPIKSSESRSKSKKFWPGSLRWTPFLTAFRSPRPTGRGWPNRGLFSVRFPRLSKNIRSWSKNTSAALFPIPTIFLPA